MPTIQFDQSKFATDEATLFELGNNLSQDIDKLLSEYVEKGMTPTMALHTFACITGGMLGSIIAQAPETSNVQQLADVTLDRIIDQAKEVIELITQPTDNPQ